MTQQFTCNCCGQPAQAQEQHTIPGRAPLIQVECKQPGCDNEYWTYTWRDGDDNTQVLSRYTPIQQEDHS